MLNGGQVPAYRDSGNRLEGETQKLMDKYYDMCIK